MSGDDAGIGCDAFGEEDAGDPFYTLIVKAGSDREALDALDANARIAIRRFSVTPMPGHSQRVLTVEFDFGDGSEWGHDPDAFRGPIEQRLNEWYLKDIADCPEGVGYPMGSLLWWRRGPSREL